MLLSMTGFGEARTQTDAVTAAAEVRAVNNRHLKVTVRGTDPYPLLESEVEKVVRRHVRRGSLLIHLRVERPAKAADLRLNAAALTGAAAGSTVGPFQTDGGWAILRVEDRRQESPPTLEEARPQILRFLTYDEVRQLLE
ncbi:MAG: peptidyl-prolyl cis-trans isomerase, partial [Gemmataceae bacterium]|nr:peptidyl-prolyl cis-trans isomerase [Gemmataceae bacterium]